MFKKIVFICATVATMLLPNQSHAQSKELCNSFALMAGQFNNQKRNNVPSFEVKYQALKSIYDSLPPEDRAGPNFNVMQTIIEKTVDYVYNSGVELPDGVVEQTVFMKCVAGEFFKIE